MKRYDWRAADDGDGITDVWMEVEPDGEYVEVRELLAELRVWRDATEARLRLVDKRGEAIPLAPDKRLFDLIDGLA